MDQLTFQNMDIYKWRFIFSKKILTLTAVMVLFSNIAVAKSSDFALGGMLGYGVTLHDGSEGDMDSYNSFTIQVLGKYRPVRFLGLRTSLGIEINTEEDNPNSNYSNKIAFDVAVGGELHTANKGSLLDPYLFIEAGYPRPIGAGLGLSISPKNSRVSFLAEVVGSYRMGIKMEYPVDNRARSISGAAFSGRLGCLFHF